MPRLIFKCPHIKSGVSASAHLKNYVGYIATREGVEMVSVNQADKPATHNQIAMVKQLVREFPLSKGLFEYEDYLTSPTRINASEFISRAIEDNLDQVAKRENYLQYIAQRPRAVRLGSHGLFTGEEDELVLNQIASAVAQHPGTVWLPILSLRREDAQRLGYDNAQRWRELLTTTAPKLAEAMKIPLEQFRWYAAFHDEGHHPHVHMVVYSADGKSGFLTRNGIAKIKSKLVSEIFQQELTEIYQRQTIRRDELTAQSREAMETLLREMETGTLENQRMAHLMVDLAQQLNSVGGRKLYGYLKAPLKALVDEIVDELAKDTRVAQAYDLWYEQREEVLSGYKDDLPERVPLSQQKELRQIKNIVIQEAVRMNVLLPLEPTQEPDLTEDLAALPDAPPPEDVSVENEKSLPHAAYELGTLYRDSSGREQNLEEAKQQIQSAQANFKRLAIRGHDGKLQYRLGWMKLHGAAAEQDKQTARELFERSAQCGNPNAQYQLAKLILTDNSPTTEQIKAAVEWLTKSAEAGQDCAQYALGKLYRDGVGVEKNMLQAVAWFALAAEQNNSYAAYAIGKIYLEGEAVPKDEEKALRWLRRSAELENQFAQYRLGRLLLAGEDIPKDIEEAVRLLTASADQGNQYAQYQLGKLYLLGHAVDRDEDTAVQWFTLSATQGNENAQWFLDHRHEFRGPSPAQCVIQLLHHMSRVFRSQDQTQTGLQIEVDKKLRQKIREKKIAMGHKPDDHLEHQAM